MSLPVFSEINIFHKLSDFHHSTIDKSQNLNRGGAVIFLTFPAGGASTIDVDQCTFSIFNHSHQKNVCMCVYRDLSTYKKRVKISCMYTVIECTVGNYRHVSILNTDNQ